MNYLFCRLAYCLAGVISMRKKKDNSLSAFWTVFIIVLILTIISLAVSTLVAFYCETPSTLQTSLFETCSTTWKLGFGAIVGLISAKATGTNNSS